MRAKRIALIGSLALAIVAFAGCGKEAKDTEVKSGLSDSVVVDSSVLVDITRIRPTTIVDSVAADSARFYFENAVQDAKRTFLSDPARMAELDLEDGRPFANRGNDRELLRRYDELQRRLHSTRN